MHWSLVAPPYSGGRIVSHCQFRWGNFGSGSAKRDLSESAYRVIH